MKFNEFKSNVQQWAAERGIYEHSTAEAQLMKALSELGELADAIIKGDDEAFKDAVGDVAVCVINAAHMENVRMDEVPALIAAVVNGEEHAVALSTPQYVVGLIAEGIGSYLSGGCDIDNAFIIPVAALAALCEHNGLDFMDCCEHAWNEIKDRKGRMVAGGAFVKEGEEKKQDGGPAFPESKGVGDVWVSEGGMTLRDYFAAQAVSAVWNRLSPSISVDKSADITAEFAYKIADAMLKERDK